MTLLAYWCERNVKQNTFFLNIIFSILIVQHSVQFVQFKMWVIMGMVGWKFSFNFFFPVENGYFVKIFLFWEDLHFRIRASRKKTNKQYFYPMGNSIFWHLFLSQFIIKSQNIKISQSSDLKFFWNVKTFCCGSVLYWTGSIRAATVPHAPILHHGPDSVDGLHLSWIFLLVKPWGCIIGNIVQLGALSIQENEDMRVLNCNCHEVLQQLRQTQINILAKTKHFDLVLQTEMC